MDKCNNRVHLAIRMTPFEMSTNTDTPIPHLIPNDNNKVPIFQVVDYVTVPDKRNIYSKGYTTNWKREFF